MKQLFITFFLLICLSIKAEERTVDNPPFRVCSHANVTIDKIELKDTETVLYMTIYQFPGYWIRIDSETYLRSNGQKYIVKSADGIQLEQIINSVL